MNEDKNSQEASLNLKLDANQKATGEAEIVSPVALTDSGAKLVSDASSDSNKINSEPNGQQEINSDTPYTRKQVRKEHTRAVKHTFLKDAVFVIVASVVLSTLMKAFLFMPFIIPSGSMENTLQVEDRILTYRLKPHPFALDRGDVVVFKDNREWMDPNNDGHQDDGDTPIQKALKFIGFMPEDDDSYLVKRVIGLPGDHVACKGTGYPVTVNGKAIDESSYIKKGSDPSSMPFDVIVPDNSLWVMGDNRNNSADSRYHQGLPTKGFVSEDDVVGDVFLIFWPSQRAQRIADVKEVFKDVPASDESSKNDADSTTLSGDLSDDSDGTSVQIGG